MIWYPGTKSPGVPNPRGANVIRGDMVPLGVSNHRLYGTPGAISLGVPNPRDTGLYTCRRLHVTDRTNNVVILVDTGAQVGVLPCTHTRLFQETGRPHYLGSQRYNNRDIWNSFTHYRTRFM